MGSGCYFVDIGGIVRYHCLNVTFHNLIISERVIQSLYIYISPNIKKTLVDNTLGVYQCIFIKAIRVGGGGGGGRINSFNPATLFCLLEARIVFSELG